jgi:hypothetical protein
MGELIDGNDAASGRNRHAQHPRCAGSEIPRAHRLIFAAAALSAGKETNKVAVPGPKRRKSTTESHAS